MGTTAKKKMQNIVKNITEADVAAFLEDNSSFFLFHEELAEKMEMPKKVNTKVVSMDDFQAERWKRKAEKLEKQNELLVKTSIFNLESEGLLRDVMVEIIQTTNTKDLTTILDTHLKDGMALDSVTLYLTQEGLGAPKMPKGTVNAIFMDEEMVKLRTIYEEEDAFMHEGMEKDICSDALLKLECDGEVYGMLALGSLDQSRFHAGQGSDLLSFFGKLLSVHVKNLIG